MKKIIIPVVLVLIGLGSYWAIAEQQEPEVISYIKGQGVNIVDTFDTPAGLKGYAAEVQGQPMSIYLTDDKQHAIIGNLIDAQGNDLGQEALYELISAPQNEKVWQHLENGQWVQDGDKDAPKVIYTFTDPFCPYCQRLREMAEPYIAAGKVQFRHIIVGILQENSTQKAASILGADLPEQALQQHIQQMEADNQLNDTATEKGLALVEQNNQLMEKLGMMATPTSVYKDEKGYVQLIEGMPMRDDIAKMFDE